MIVNDILRQVGRLAGDSTGRFITAQDVFDWVNDAQLEIARKTLIMGTVLTQNTVVGDPSYDFSSLLEITRVTYDGRTLQPISVHELDDLFPVRDNDGNGVPRYYYRWGVELYLHPAPSEVKELKVMGKTTPTEVDDINDALSIPEFMHSAVLVLCKSRAYERDGKPNQASQALGEFYTQIAQLTDEAQSDSESSYPAIRDIEVAEY